MSVRDLIPWNRNEGNRVPSVFRDSERDPFLSLHREVNRLFDDVFRGFGSNLPAFNGASTCGGGWRATSRSRRGGSPSTRSATGSSSASIASCPACRRKGRSR